MDNLPNNLNVNRYLIESFDILIPNDKEPIKISNSQINSLFLEKDFDNDYFPVFRLKLSVEAPLYYKIIENKNNVKFRIRMQKYVYKEGSTFNIKKDVINELFSIFLDEDTPFIDKKLYEETLKLDNTDKNLRDYGTELTLYLFKENDLINTKKIINKIVGGNLTQILAYCFSTVGIRNVLLSPIENKNVYNQVLLPPLPLIGTIKYLENAYGGFYSKGMSLFFDLNTVYVLDNIPRCTAWRVNEYKQTVFTIKDALNSNKIASGSKDSVDEKKYYINVAPDNIKIYNDSVLQDQIEGNNLIIIHPSSGSVQTINSNSNQHGSGTYKVLVNKFNNSFINNIEKTRLNENSVIISISIGDFDNDALSPNKEFVFVFENTNINKKYGGNYRISRVVYVFTKKGEEFVINANCEFKKTR